MFVSGCLWCLVSLLSAAAHAPIQPIDQSSQNAPYVVADQQDLSVDGRRTLPVISPDGALFLTLYDDPDLRLCLHETETLAEVRCADLPSSSVDLDHVAWSPNGEYVAFTENAIVFFADSDLWIFETETGDVTNLTDDGWEGAILSTGADTETAPNSLPVDILPTWSPDGQSIAFVRNVLDPPAAMPTSIYQISVAGGEPELVTGVAVDTPFAVFAGMEWIPGENIIYYSVFDQQRTEPANGIWVVDVESGDTRQITSATNEERGGQLLIVVGTEETAVAYYPFLLAQLEYPYPSAFVTIDLASGRADPILGPESGDEAATVTDATLSPDGNWLLIASMPDGQLTLRNVATGDDHLLTTIGQPITSRVGVGIIWNQNDTVLLISGGSQVTLLTLEAVDA